MNINPGIIQEEEYNFPYHYSDLFSNYKYNFWAYIKKNELIIKCIPPSKRVLDLGCGDGRLLYELRKKGFNVDGLDYSKKAIAFAKAFNPQLKIYCKKLSNFNPPYKYEVVTLIDVIEHINPHEICSFVNGISQLVSKKGYLIVSVPSKDVPTIKKHFQHFDRDLLVSTFESHFVNKKIISFCDNGWNYRIYKILRGFGIPLYAFRNFYPFSLYFVLFERYFEKKVMCAPSGKCRNLIGIFIKK